MTTDTPQLVEPLTRRENEVLERVRRGLTNRQIAHELDISADGVKFHVSSILGKLGVRSRYEAAVWPKPARWWAGALGPVALWWRRARPGMGANLSTTTAWVTGALLFVAVGGLALLVFVLARDRGAGANSEAAQMLALASAAMADRSFSVITCPTCDPPSITEFAPPDRIKLSNSPSHDAWRYNLVVSGRWYFSSRGDRWLEGVAPEVLSMVIGDPRTLLRYARDAELQDDELLNGKDHHLVAAHIDGRALVGDVLKPNLEDEPGVEEQHFKAYERLLGGLAVRFWINSSNLLVTQMELDYPRPDVARDSGDGAQPEATPEDPPPAIVVFDYEASVDVPVSPISLPAEEANSLDDQVEEGENVIRRALAAYVEEVGQDPPRLDQGTLGGFLDSDWPVNPYSEQPMRQSAEYSPGDFCYEPGIGEQRYRFGVYGWDNSLGQTIPGCIPAEGEG